MKKESTDELDESLERITSAIDLHQQADLEIKRYWLERAKSVSKQNPQRAQEILALVNKLFSSCD